MPNIVITSTANAILFDNGSYSGTQGSSGLIQKKDAFNKSAVSRVSLAPSDAFVVIDFKASNLSLSLVYAAATGSLIVDTVGGAAPSDNSDLYNKIVALLG